MEENSVPVQIQNKIEVVSTNTVVDRVDYIYRVLVDGAESLEALNRVTSKLEKEIFTDSFLDAYQGKEKADFYERMMKLKNAYADTMRKVNSQFDMENFIKVFGISSIVSKFKDLSPSAIKELSLFLEDLKNRTQGNENAR